MIVRKMPFDRLSDVKALLDICFGESTWSVEMLRSQYTKPDSSCTLAVEDETIIGFLAFEQVLDEGSIIEICVHPAYRRRGIAKKLIDQAVENADGLKTIVLEVRERNTPAITMYEAIGFERVGIRKNYYDHPKDNALIMVREVSKDK